MSKRIAVLLGGRSAEREVSLVSGAACAETLRARGHEVIEIDPKDGVDAVMAGLQPRPDVVLNALHGRWGEDGCIQGLLELLGLAYTHSGVLASSLAMDKPMAKKLFREAGLPCAESLIASREAILAGDVMPRPYVVKPSNEGSSVGVTIVLEGTNEPLNAERIGTSEMLMVERYVPGQELTVGVLGGQPLAVTEIRPRQGFYDYTAKYTEGKADHLLPAPVPEPVYRHAMDLAVAAHHALGCEGVSRADFRYDARESERTNRGLYLLEVNTQPGMTPLSLVPEQAAHVGMDFSALVEWMVENPRCAA
jgi:D-alanine-D-alanine ligase